MLYTPEQINTVINNIVVTQGLDVMKVNGTPLGVMSNEVDIDRYGARLLSQPLIANPFITAFYQQFIYRATAQNYFTSPFDYFREKRDGVAFGTYEADVQPIFPLKYDMKAFDRVLEFWETPVIAQYFAITRQDTIPQTITKNQLRQAFASYEAFDNFLAKLIIAPRQGNVIVETNAIKMMLNNNLASGVIKRATFTEPTTESGWKELAAEIVGVANGMVAEPTTEYNNYANIEGSDGQPAWAQSDRRDLVLIGDSKVLAKLKTFVLAMAYNKEDVDFKFHFIEVNSFNYSTYDYETRTFKNEVTSPLKLLLCDGGYIKLEDNLDEDYSDPNIMTMGLQRALQIQQTIGLRVSRNALAWVEGDETVEPLTLLNAPVQYVDGIEEGDNAAFTFNRALNDDEVNGVKITAFISSIGKENESRELTEGELDALNSEAFEKGMSEDKKTLGFYRYASFSEASGVAAGTYNSNQIVVFVITVNDNLKFNVITPADFPTT